VLTTFVQAAHGIESLVLELSTWALSMPSYADPLCGIAATILTLFLDRCDAAFRSLLQQQPHLAALLDKSDVVDALEREPGLRFVEEEDLFEDPYKEVSPSASDAVLRAVMTGRVAAPDAADQVCSATHEAPRAFRVGFHVSVRNVVPCSVVSMEAQAL
jgi:hypothetical protein